MSSDCFEWTLWPGSEEREAYMGSSSVRQGAFGKFWGLNGEKRSSMKLLIFCLGIRLIWTVVTKGWVFSPD